MGGDLGTQRVVQAWSNESVQDSGSTLGQHSYEPPVDLRWTVHLELQLQTPRPMQRCFTRTIGRHSSSPAVPAFTRYDQILEGFVQIGPQAKVLACSPDTIVIAVRRAHMHFSPEIDSFQALSIPGRWKQRSKFAYKKGSFSPSASFICSHHS